MVLDHRFDDEDTIGPRKESITAEELIQELKKVAPATKVYLQDVGCGCCSWYTGVAIDKDAIGAVVEGRLVLGRAEDQDD